MAAHRFAIAYLAPILFTSLVFRLLWLDHLPGVNGDEAWYGVQVSLFLDGQIWSGRTPTGLPINPLLFGTEALLLSLFEPSFWVLRAPIVIWSMVALAVTFPLYRWVYNDATESGMLVALTACLPAHVAYSRFCWDGSFSFLSLPLVLFPMLRILNGRQGRLEITLFVCGIVLTIWIHATHALLVAAALLILAWEFRERCFDWLRAHPITAAVIAAVCLGVIGGVARESQLAKTLVDSIASSVPRLPRHLVGLAQVILGDRVYEYLSGQPTTDWTVWTTVVFYTALAGVLCILLQWGAPIDRKLAIFFIILFVELLLTGRLLRLHRASYERYILYVVPLMALLAVRAVSAFSRHRGTESARFIGRIGLCSLSCLCLIQIWSAYFQPLRHQLHQAQLHRTFLSDDVEPKAAAAAELRKLIANGTAPHHGYAEDWWVHHAIQYLLGPRCRVEQGVPPNDPQKPAFVVGFGASPYLQEVIARVPDRAEVQKLHFGRSGHTPIVTVLVIDSRKHANTAAN